MKATFIRSRHLSDFAAGSSEASLALGAAGVHSARPLAMSAGALVASDDRFQVEVKPSARTARSAGENWPPKDGLGQSELSVQRVESAAGTQPIWPGPLGASSGR